MKKHAVVLTYLALVLFTIAPLLSALIAGGIADLCGATLNEGNVHPCVVFGVDIGGLLYAMGVAGWFMLLTIPLGTFAIVVFTIALCVVRFYSYLEHRRKLREDSGERAKLPPSNPD